MATAVEINGVKVYNLSGRGGGAATPKWTENAAASVKKKESGGGPDDDSLELLQGLEFTTACTRVKTSPDGEFLLASGVHPPAIKAFEFRNLSQKFERRVDAEIVDFQVLTADYSKLALLCADRAVRLHARFGSYHSVRTPRQGRTLAYHAPTAELLVGGSAAEVYRINLSQGRLMPSLPCRSPAVNVLGVSPTTSLLAAGGEDGALELFDTRARAAVGRVEVCAPREGGSGGRAARHALLYGEDKSGQVTSLRFSERDPLLVAAGTSEGLVKLYDLRSSRPLLEKDHRNGEPIVDIKFHAAAGVSDAAGAGGEAVLSADKHCVKVWAASTGEPLVSIQPQPEAGEINDVCVIPRSGLIFCAMDAPRLLTYFVPALGPAPRWGSFLENVTEEMEEQTADTVYVDFKFVSREELPRLGLEHLVGTNLLRPYMHGFFVNHRLYEKARRLSKPFEYEEYRLERVRDKVEAARTQRITVRKRVPKVNRALAEKLQAGGADKGGKGKGGKKGVDGAAILADSRFAALFNDARFAVQDNER